MVAMVAAGMRTEEILAEHPDLTPRTSTSFWPPRYTYPETKEPRD
jgi:uncharacterized protein (DUF433 family)